MPKPLSESGVFGSTLAPSLSGFIYRFGADSSIRIEHSLTGAKDLNNLMVEIQKEKTSPKYSWFYQPEDDEPKYKVAKHENVSIGQLNAVYFETDPVEIKGALDQYKEKEIGYNFVFEGKPVSVWANVIDYGSLKNKTKTLDSEAKAKQATEAKVKEGLIHVVSSFKKYDGKSSFKDLDSNLAEVLDDGESISNKAWGEKKLAFNLVSRHVTNGGFGVTGSKSLFVLPKAELGYKGDSTAILDYVLKGTLVASHDNKKEPLLSYDVPWGGWEITEGKLEKTLDTKIAKKGTMTVNGIKFNTYLLEGKYHQSDYNGITSFVATADIEGEPVVFSYAPNLQKWKAAKAGYEKGAEAIAHPIETMGKTWLLSINLYKNSDEANKFYRNR